MPQLKLDEIADALHRLPNWQFENGALTKEWTFANFGEAMAFTNSVAEMAELAEHHPDIMINYNQVRLTLETHSEGGVTEKDVALARQIEDAGIGARERRGKDRRAEERRQDERRNASRRVGPRRKKDG
jgi:4a-hydroxytetrahydrobiopterin dehydratase